MNSQFRLIHGAIEGLLSFSSALETALYDGLLKFKYIVLIFKLSSHYFRRAVEINIQHHSRYYAFFFNYQFLFNISISACTHHLWKNKFFVKVTTTDDDLLYNASVFYAPGTWMLLSCLIHFRIKKIFFLNESARFIIFHLIEPKTS